ncbi:hypothetical protein [Streptomyces sp. NPDC056061]|uniref:hypothetical protein n=1 Tax=Streptomyces sp. NPDC056061 TaxID=3345700 RepID=UPI0035D6F0FC
MAAGRTPQDVVGGDATKFAASWARARVPFASRLLRMAARVSCVIGGLILTTCLVRWTTERAVSVGDLAFWAVVGAVTVAWELRRGSLGLGRNMTVALVVAVVVVLLFQWLDGGEALFTLPLWMGPVLLLPGLPYAVADARSRKNTAPGVDLGLSRNPRRIGARHRMRCIASRRDVRPPAPQRAVSSSNRVATARLAAWRLCRRAAEWLPGFRVGAAVCNSLVAMQREPIRSPTTTRTLSPLV